MKRKLLLFLLAVFFTGCIDFGKDVELSGKQVDDHVLAEVTELTGVVFPEGTMGKEYVYHGSGIDDALVIKVSIPDHSREEFLKNTIFVSGRSEEPYINLVEEKNWWNVESLLLPVHTIYEFSDNGNMIECSIGNESDETVVYMTWISV